MFLTGYEETLCGLAPTSVYSYYNGDIQRWAPFDDWPYHPDNYVGYVFPFQGQYYMTGLVNDTLGGYYGFLRYTGTTWEPVPGFEVYGPIKKVLIHNNKLYVGGYFWKANGQPGNAIACFDGSTWDDLGGGMHYAPYAPPTPNGSVVDMFFDGDTLYAMGQFQHAGGIPANNIAKWNGVQWCSLPGVFDHYGNFRATKWNGHLYVIGGFYSVDGVVAHQIARYLGGSYVEDCSAPVGIPELTTARLSAHPNPFTTQTRVRCSEVITSDQVVEVVDINGRVLRSFRGIGSHEALITRDGLAAGLYVLRLMHQGRHLSSVRVVAE